MPPIMGAGAFLLSELTETPYSDIIKIALIPALLYYLSVGLIVYFRAVRFKLHGVPVEELPQWSTIIPRLHLLLPIPVMVYLLVWVGDSPFLAAAKTIVLIVMLKACDLLCAIRTRRSDELWKPFLAVSIVFGILVYVFGIQVGPPFTWFVENYVGINIVDAGYWVLGAFLALKIAEIAVYGPDQSVIANPDTPHLHGESVAHAGDSGSAAVGRVFVELGKTIWASLEAGARNTLVVSCIVGVLGILLSAATQSDLPSRIADVLTAASFGLLPLTIFWVIVAGYIVGMGLPIVASYVILAVFAVGALTNLGVDPLIAHMICYWVAVVSAVTPPVALAAYAASAISGGDPVKTGNQALKLASMILITPFIFAYAPAVLLVGSDLDIVVTTGACVLGVVAWAKFLDGFGAGRHVPFERMLWLAAATLILMPVDHFYDWVAGVNDNLQYESYALGAAIMVLVFVYQRTGRRTVPA
jgi:TRAP transporter 4TM/12TM fusion protein